MQGSVKKIAVPLDGSANAMDALRYLQMIYSHCLPGLGRGRERQKQ